MGFSPFCVIIYSLARTSCHFKVLHDITCGDESLYIFMIPESEAVVQGVSTLSIKEKTCISGQGRPFYWLFHFHSALHA
jgi:hypothetical protein